MKPLRNRVIVRPVKDEKKGLALAEDKKVFKGEVVAVGAKVEEVKVGDRIIYSPFHFEEVEEDVHVIEELDVWAIL